MAPRENTNAARGLLLPWNSPASTALKVREMPVAHAAPATPQGSTATNSRSSAMFSMQQIARKMSGQRESPTARRMPEPMLKRSIPAAPR